MWTEDRNRQTSPDERGRIPSALTPLPAGEGNSEFGAVASSGVPSAKSGLGQSHRGALPSAERGIQIAAEQKVLFATLSPGDKESVATWEARVLVPKGIYRFSARV